MFVKYIDGLVQDCSISVADALEIMQSCTKPSTCISTFGRYYSFEVTNSLSCDILTLSNNESIVCVISSKWLTKVMHWFQSRVTFYPNYELLLKLLIFKDLKANFDGLVQDCSIPIASELKILQSCTKPLTWCLYCSVRLQINQSNINSLKCVCINELGHHWSW